MSLFKPSSSIDRLWFDSTTEGEPVNCREYEYHCVSDNPVRVFRSNEPALKTTSEKNKNPKNGLKKKHTHTLDK